MTLVNNSSSAQTIDIITEVTLPDGSTYGPIINAPNRTLSSGAEISRNLSQNIPASAPPGTYIYHAKISDAFAGLEDEDYFYFEKAVGGDNGGEVKV